MIRRDDCVIRGEPLEYSCKTILAIILACILEVIGIVFAFREKDWTELIIPTIFLLEVIVIGIYHRRIHPAWKAVPMVQFTIGSITIIVHGVIEYNLNPEVLFALLVNLTMPVIASAAMLTIIKDSSMNKQESIMRLVGGCMMALSLLDFGICLDAVTQLDHIEQILGGFLERFFLYLSMICLAIPDSVLMNVRRIVLIAENTLLRVVPLFIVIISAISLRNYLVPSSDSVPTISLSIALSIEISVVISLWKESGLLSVFKSGSNNLTINDNLERNFATEYSRRMMNTDHGAAEIKEFQSRLNQIKNQLTTNGANDNCAALLNKLRLEKEALAILKKLELYYYFNTRIDFTDFKDVLT